jgi:poly-gamma-glutamate synthesis protein (capsule biosynthesis protein)
MKIFKPLGIMFIGLTLLFFLFFLPRLQNYQLPQQEPTPTTRVSAYSSADFVTPLEEMAGSSFFQGKVINLDGEAIAGAIVWTNDQQVTTDNEGNFSLPASENAGWISVQHPDYLSRTRAAAQEVPVLFRLTPDDGKTISIHFVGDTMFGRRFYDPNEDGDVSDGLLPIDAGANEHLALLSHVKPLLENADLTIINLETALTEDPYVDPTSPRPDRFHPTKEYIFASDTSSAIALKQAGVDIIDIANNHLYDLLDSGVAETIDALEKANFSEGSGYFGAGLTESQAWQPAVVELNGQTVAVMGCTSITYPFIDGVTDKTAISYIASDTEEKGGAARCEEARIRTEVSAAVAKYGTVIFMVHGGSEYERAATDFVVRMTNAARQAGATLIVNHQPHVVGGFDWDGKSLVAWTLGNFMFDQTIWATFEAYVFAVHLRDGKVVNAYTEPLMIEEFQPKGVTQDMAAFVARRAAGREPGPFVVENGAMNIDVGKTAKRYSLTVPIYSANDAVYQLADGWWVSDVSNWDDLRLGQDILWVGSFEDQDIDLQAQEGALWDIDQANKFIGSEYAYSGVLGARIQNGARGESDIVLAPIHRLPAVSGTSLTILGKIRSTPKASLIFQMSWYPDTRGGSDTQTRIPIKVQAPNVWETFRFDVIVPENTVAMGLFLKLSPPVDGLVNADFDDIRIIEWEPNQPTQTRLYNYFQLTAGDAVTVSKDVLPGGTLGTIDTILQPVE